MLSGSATVLLMTATTPTPQRLCSIDGCEKAHYGKGWCQMHYRRWKTTGSTGPSERIHAPRAEHCSVVGCKRSVHSKNLCTMHYQRVERTRQEREVGQVIPVEQKRSPCKVEGCGTISACRGLCGVHYARWQRHGDPLYTVPPKECLSDGCERKHFGQGFCEMHHARVVRSGRPLGPAETLRAPAGTECIIEGCARPFSALGYCAMHYSRVRLQGDAGDAVPLGGTSQREKALASFVASLGVDLTCNSKSVIAPRQLDIYIPERNIAIEFNGNYWHSESKVGRGYHEAKYLACKEKGVRLVQIWEDEWDNHRSVVEAMLRRKILGSQGGAVGARKTQLAALTKAESDAFLEPLHIQGGARGSHYIALTLDGAVVAVGVFLRRNSGEVELVRYASMVTVQGGLSKMMKHIGPGRYVTFADHCVSDGSLYEKTGWVADRVLSPDYRYLVAGERVHKFNYRLARFRDDPDLLWEDGLTERELAVLNGLPRIYDAGKTRYVKVVS